MNSGYIDWINRNNNFETKTMNKNQDEEKGKKIRRMTMLSKVCASYLPTFLHVGMRAYTLHVCVFLSPTGSNE